MFNFKKILRWLIISLSFLVIVLTLILTVGRSAIFPRKKSSESKKPKNKKEKPTGDVTNMNTVKVNDFKLTLSADKESYKKEEPVEIEFVIKNESSSEKNLSYGSGQEFDFWIQSEEGSEVWRWSEGKFFTMALQEVKLKPGEKKAYGISWDQKDSRGMQVASGGYSVLAQSVAAELKDKQVEISIACDL